MRAALLEGEEGHVCHSCDKIYLGGPGDLKTVEKLADDYPEGTPLEDLSTYTYYYCKDPRGACELTEDDITFISEVWECGECERLHASVQQAMECCT